MCHRVGALRESLQPQGEVSNDCVMMGSYYLPECTIWTIYPLDVSYGRLICFHKCVNFGCCRNSVCFMCSLCSDNSNLSCLCDTSRENVFNCVWHVLKKTATGYFDIMSHSLKCFSTISCTGTCSYPNSHTADTTKSWETCVASNCCSALH